MNKVMNLFKKVFKPDTDIPGQAADDGFQIEVTTHEQAAIPTEPEVKAAAISKDRKFKAKVIETVLNDLQGRVVRLTFINKATYDYPVYQVVSVVANFLELRGCAGRFGKRSEQTFWQNLSSVDSIAQLTGDEEERALNG